jgi:hypothetical protein
MINCQKKERRLSPRIDKQLPVKIIANGYDFATSTKNLSCVGAYCRIDKYIPPFTRVNIKLNLPPVINSENSSSPIECKGVIVRTEDENSGGFNIAIFFNGITEVCRKRISQYVSHYIS